MTLMTLIVSDEFESPTVASFPCDPSMILGMIWMRSSELSKLAAVTAAVAASTTKVICELAYAQDPWQTPGLFDSKSSGRLVAILESFTGGGGIALDSGHPEFLPDPPGGCEAQHWVAVRHSTGWP